jgi:molybdopterin-guanine dinucleotide biosynthesis protein A
MTLEGKNKGRHEKLTLSSFGNFATSEYALIGAPCHIIRKTAEEIAHCLGEEKCIYVDADHHSKEDDAAGIHGFNGYISDKISFNRIETKNKFSRIQYRALHASGEIALINGNHFHGSRQIIVLHPDKLESLSRKLEKLTQPVAVIFTEEINELPGFLKDHLSSLNLDIPIVSINNYLDIIKSIILSISVPSINALILAGGKSERMGMDKTKFEFYGKTQKEHLYTILIKHAENVYISCREDQIKEEKLPALGDRLNGMGPYGAILSALMFDPNKAWLVLASDMPFMDEAHIEQLIQNRNPFKTASAFISPKNGDPEPLACIWEPGAYPQLLNLLSLGYTCPRKALIQSNTQLIQALNNKALININTPDEYQQALDLLK